MKSLMIGAMALSLAAGAAATDASAQVVRKEVTQTRNGRHVVTQRVTQRPNGQRVVTRTNVRPNGNRVATRTVRWNRGQRLPASYYGRDRYVDWRAHRLRQPPGGYQWVDVDGEDDLVAIATGLIADALLSN
jgi:Ni/Co efflux regulator RcnB